MPRYAIINNTLVENVIIADGVPTVPGRTVVALTATQAVSPGDTYSGGTFVPYTPSAQEVARREAPQRLRNAYQALRTWSADAAADAAAYDAMTAAQRQAAQKRTIDRFGRVCDGLADLLLHLAVDS